MNVQQPGSVDLSNRDAIEVELNSYLDPLEWWSLHQARFLRVASLARKYLCIPATHVLAEKAFSTGGNIVTCHRSALKPETVDRTSWLIICSSCYKQ
ncbi:Zinc finger BED domain-containing protein 1 [Merluccius polli]|uniref:Zinc finger BED domain-containing protein 1 n=1 Tax=Merluccius polli TaxID=89951 RepID=A0AA47NYT1_MERPO|nr:Zinc finger BED domain-containing protein 1 [Merluccius polli]